MLVKLSDGRMVKVPECFIADLQPGDTLHLALGHECYVVMNGDSPRGWKGKHSR